MRIFKHKTSAMQKISNAVSRGAHRYIQGSISKTKFQTLYWKFVDRYEIERSSQQRWRKSKSGFANSELIAWLHPIDKSKIEFALLVTDGEGVVCDLEQLKDCRKKKERIVLEPGYELICLARKGMSPGWTWRMQKSHKDDVFTSVQYFVRKRDLMKIRQTLYRLRRIPPFRALRRDAYDIQNMMLKEWKRTQRGEFPYPKVKMPFLGRFKTSETI